MEKNARILFQLTTGEETLPIEGAIITVYDDNSNLIAVTTTDESGRSEEVQVSAPDRSLSLDPEMLSIPYSVYNAYIEAEGYIPVVVNGIQVYEGINSIQQLELNPMPKGRGIVEEVYTIPPPEIATEGQPLDPSAIPSEEVQERILKTVYIPSKITVHLGSPNNTSAQNVTVSFPDYIKNVASSEIYPTWPDSALRANIYSQITFALNRVYTEWYRSRGYNFDITNNTAYDQFFVPGRNIFENISKIVDEIYNEYVRKQGALNPLFTQYCNGTTVTCDGLSQWGTVYLAEQGYTPLQILKYYYGNDIEITQTDNIQDIISSYPGYVLKKGMKDPDVVVIKQELNRIRKNYPAIPQINNMNDTFDEETYRAVKEFQKIFNLTQDGIVGKATWNKLSYIYVAVLKLAELNGGIVIPSIPETAPTILLKLGSKGAYVKLAQYFLAVIGSYYNEISPVDINGVFDEKTKAAVIDFQNLFGLTADGIIGPKTWNELYNAFLGIANTSGIVVEYPGFLLKVGSRGDQVWLMQSYLQKISTVYNIPYIAADGIFGNMTKNAVIAFQNLFGLTPDGIIGQKTWDRIVAVRMLLK